jgi:hypothetical protein
VFKYMNLTQHLFFILSLLPAMVLANTELPDPTRPATYIVEDIEPVFFDEIDVKEKINWKLSAIRISSEDRTAILNGKLVRAGDDIGPAKVLEINPLSIVIDHDERKLIVRLYNTSVIKDYKSRK